MNRITYLPYGLTIVREGDQATLCGNLMYELVDPWRAQDSYSELAAFVLETLIREFAASGLDVDSIGGSTAIENAGPKVRDYVRELDRR
ncbi:MAG TPA: hypothetical protein VMK32_05415 [Burkholderiaceae bacterium]|jgi:hypothetical protein|nr:hypothetical protein [Burkholderiaceae bacterium]